MQNKRVKGLIDALKTGEINDTFDEESEKDRLLQEGTHIAQELDRYSMPLPSVRLPSYIVEPEIDTHGNWVTASIRDDGMLAVGVMLIRSTHPAFGRITADDIRRAVDNGRKRLMGMEKSIDEAISMYSGDALAGIMEGKDKRKVVQEIAGAKVRELEGHFDYITPLPDELFLNFWASTDKFALHGSYSSSMERVVISKEIKDSAKGRSRKWDNPLVEDIAFLKDFPQIEETIMLRAEKLKREIKNWIRRSIE